MKLGDVATDPLTGRTGFLHKFVNGIPLYRDATGRLFKCEVSDGPWLDGEMTGPDRATVTSPCPVWHGAIVNRRDAKIQVVR